MGKQYYHSLDGYVLCFSNVIYAGNVHRPWVFCTSTFYSLEGHLYVRRNTEAKKLFCVTLFHK